MAAVSARWADAGAAAASHLLSHGCVPLLQAQVLEALWQRGGADRRLAQRLYQLTGGVAA